MSRGFLRGGIEIVRVVLDKEAFGLLVAGQTVIGRGFTSDGSVGIEMMLSDIGWEAMFEAIRAAMDNRVANDG